LTADIIKERKYKQVDKQVNIIAVPFTVLGLMHPVIAEIAMATSSVSVVANANMLRKIPIKPAYSHKH